MAKVMVALSVSLDGFIAGPDDGPEQPLGKGGMRLFDWYFDGDTPSRYYQAASSRGVSVPPFKLSSSSAEVFDELVESGGAGVTGRRTYDIADAWGGNGPAPGLPLSLLPTTSLTKCRKREPLHLRHRRRGERHRAGESGGR